MDEFIRDRLVIGLKDKGDKVRLLREKKLDLQKAIQMCTSSEVASRQMKNIQGCEDKQTEEVKKFNERKKKPKKPPRKKDEEKSFKVKKNEDEKRKRENSETKCRYCGRKQCHVRRMECPAFGQTCSKCQKKGHFASLCISFKKVHQLETAMSQVQMRVA